METTNMPPSKVVENEAFWQNHYKLQKASNLSRVDYCKQHDLNYDRFSYWVSKWNSSHGKKLISVKLKSTTYLPEQPILCTLDLKNGKSLKIHNAQALAIILERYC